MLPIEIDRRVRRTIHAEPSERPLTLLYETRGQRQTVAHACERAMAAGIRPGMALSVARAAVSGDALLIEPDDPRRTRRALRGLALWCHRFSPTVALDEPQGLSLDITGCAHLFGGERKMSARIRRALRQRGFGARIAIAPTYAGARALARHADAPETIVDECAFLRALRPLPIAALPLDADGRSGFVEVNVRGIGEVLALPRAAIAARFGQDVLRAVDRLVGRAPETIAPVRPRQPTRVERLFEGPCSTLDTIGIACRDLLTCLCDALVARAVGALEWDVALRRSDLGPLVIPIRHSAPARDPVRMWSLLEPRLERAHLGFGVDGITITANRTTRVRPKQRGWGDTNSEALHTTPAVALVDTLVNRLGEHAVLRAGLRESHIPERASVQRSALDPAPLAVPTKACEGDRPTRLFDHPAEARVIALSPDGPVRQLEWREGTHTLTTCIGPERIKGEWWDDQRTLRDYFKVQDERGRWLWVFRDHALGSWFVHGEWA